MLVPDRQVPVLQADTDSKALCIRLSRPPCTCQWRRASDSVGLELPPRRLVTLVCLWVARASTARSKCHSRTQSAIGAARSWIAIDRYDRFPSEQEAHAVHATASRYFRLTGICELAHMDFACSMDLKGMVPRWATNWHIPLLMRMPDYVDRCTSSNSGGRGNALQTINQVVSADARRRDDR
jgi:hypothetical protein